MSINEGEIRASTLGGQDK